jgi:hypothetical protein
MTSNQLKFPRRLYYTWFTRSVEGTHMKEVNLGYIFQLGAEIYPLTQLKSENRWEITDIIFHVDLNIDRLLDEYPSLSVCRRRGEQLLTSISHVQEWVAESFKKERQLNRKSDKADNMFGEVVDNAKAFADVLLPDLEQLKVYHPLRKAGFDTLVLISNAEENLTKSTLAKLDENTKKEFREWGRCLAFDLYTASGFHIIRALEVLIHEYYVLMCKPINPKKKLDSWAEYLRQLYIISRDENMTLNKEDKEHVKKLLAFLMQIKNKDRNYIMHTEVMLSEDEAISLGYTAIAIIQLTAEKLEDKSL